jgi:hypothetical protein
MFAVDAASIYSKLKNFRNKWRNRPETCIWPSILNFKYRKVIVTAISILYHAWFFRLEHLLIRYWTCSFQITVFALYLNTMRPSLCSLFRRHHKIQWTWWKSSEIFGATQRSYLDAIELYIQSLRKYYTFYGDTILWIPTRSTKWT